MASIPLARLFFGRPVLLITFDQPAFRRLQEFADDGNVVPSGFGNLEGGGHVDSEYVP
jgi:hypothetical protein